MATQISVDEVKDLLKSDQEIAIIDIRDPASFEQGHLDLAVNITQHEIEAFIENEDKQKPVLCYCYHGIGSVSAADFLISKGFKTVYSMDGGYEEWKETN